MGKTVGRIPGDLKPDSVDQLVKLALGKRVLQLGCYCGRGLVVVADCAAEVWVLDDFRYLTGISGVVEELKANVDRCVAEDKTINLLYGNAEGWAVPFGSRDLNGTGVEVVYRDANRSEEDRKHDDQLAYNVLRKQGGIYVWHDADHDLKWLQVEPVSVEVN